MTRVWRAIRDSLTPDVDPHAASFLGRRIAGRTGPVWSLAAWALAMALFTTLNNIALSLSMPVGVTRQLIWAYWIASAIVVALVGNRLPGWVIHLVVDVNVVVVGLQAYIGLSDLRAAATLTLLVIPVLYCATWFSRVTMSMHLMLVVLVSAVVTLGRGPDADTARVWFTLIAVCIGLAYFINALVNHLNQQAIIDPLTGLFNRSGLRVLAGMHERGGSGLPRTVVVIDLDGFKQINDVQGHHAGDRILRRVGDIMRTHLRPGDTVTRTGGDEFLILLSRTDIDQARAIVERLVESLPIPASSGMVAWTADLTMDQAINAADQLMYEQKQARKRDSV